MTEKMLTGTLNLNTNKKKFCLQFQIRTYAAALCIDTKFKGGNDNFGLAPCIKDGQGGGEQVKFKTDES